MMQTTALVIDNLSSMMKPQKPASEWGRGKGRRPGSKNLTAEERAARYAEMHPYAAEGKGRGRPKGTAGIPHTKGRMFASVSPVVLTIGKATWEAAEFWRYDGARGYIVMGDEMPASWNRKKSTVYQIGERVYRVNRDAGFDFANAWMLESITDVNGYEVKSASVEKDSGEIIDNSTTMATSEDVSVDVDTDVVNEEVQELEEVAAA